MMKNRNYYFLLLVMVAILSSCNAYKNIPYFQDVNRTANTQEMVNNYAPLTISPSDVIGINVTSRTPENSAIFNYSAKDLQSTITGYTVDQNGNLQLPLIGTLQVGGQTTAQLQDKVSAALLTFFKDPVVNIRIINFKVAVYGDVQRPDVYHIKDERITITQALTLAGDLNITAKRKTVTLIREENGKRNFIPIDLTSKKIFQSPYYYLKSNDELYVQPDRSKFATIDRGRTASLVLSALSVAAIVFSVIY